MKKIATVLLTFFVMHGLLQAQGPINQSTKVDGLRPITPTQTIKPIEDIQLIKPGSTLNNKPSICDQTLPNAKRFKILTLNTRNGGVWFIGQDDRLYGVGNHYQNCQLATITSNSRVENLTANFGALLAHSIDGVGMMRGGNPDPEHVRIITMPSGHPFPAPKTNYVYSDCEGGADQLWYLNEKGYIKSATSTTSTSNIPPEKFAKMFTVYAKRFFLIDENQDLYMWKPGFEAWKKMGVIKALFLTTDVGLSTPLWYIGTDNMVYQLSTEEPLPTPMNAKAKSIAVFGSQLYFIGMDGYFYIRLKNKDFRVDL